MPETRLLEYLVIVEDPDAPLPQPVVHGIYYGIPNNKTTLVPDDFQPSSGKGKSLGGGFKFGVNRPGNVWSGPKPVLGHGLHRYMFQVIGLKSKMEEGRLGDNPTKAHLEKAVEGNIMSWGMWIGTYERKL